MKGLGCEYQATCPYVNSDLGCGEDRHHLYFPKNEYKTRVERVFRNLGCNVIEMCRKKHNDLHATGEKPRKPTREEMLLTIRSYDGS